MEPQITTPVVAEKHIVHQVTPLSKYLAMVLFVILPFVGGWIGYTYTPEKVVEVETVTTVGEVPDTKVSTLDRQAVASVLGEIAGGYRNSFKYPLQGSKTTDTVLAVMKVLKENQYQPQDVTQSPEKFMLKLHNMVEDQNFDAIASFIPAQGLLSSGAWPDTKIEGRSSLYGGVVWSRESIRDLVTREVFDNVVSDAKTSNYSSFLYQKNPIRNRVINFNNINPEAAETDVVCKILNDELTREDIMSAAIIDQSMVTGKIYAVEGTEFSKTIYECGSEFGGHGNRIYIQPIKDGSSYQVLAVQDYFWE